MLSSGDLEFCTTLKKFMKSFFSVHPILILYYQTKSANSLSSYMKFHPFVFLCLVVEHQHSLPSQYQYFWNWHLFCNTLIRFRCTCSIRFWRPLKRGTYSFINLLYRCIFFLELFLGWVQPQFTFPPCHDPTVQKIAAINL